MAEVYFVPILKVKIIGVWIMSVILFSDSFPLEPLMEESQFYCKVEEWQLKRDERIEVLFISTEG